MSESKKRSLQSARGAGLAIGMGLGTALGVAMDKLAIGVAIGVALGLGLDAAFSRRPVRPERDDEADK